MINGNIPGKKQREADNINNTICGKFLIIFSLIILLKTQATLRGSR